MLTFPRLALLRKSKKLTFGYAKSLQTHTKFRLKTETAIE